MEMREAARKVVWDRPRVEAPPGRKPALWIERAGGKLQARPKSFSSGPAEDYPSILVCD